MEENIKTKYDTSKLLFVKIDENGIVTFVNTKICEVLNYTKKEIIGKNWIDNFVPNYVKTKVQKNSKLLLSNKYKTATSFEYPVLNKNGKELIIHWHNSPIFDADFNSIGYISSGINSNKKSEKESNIIEKSNSIIILWEKAPHWPVKFISKNVERILGYSEDDFLSGKLCYEDIIYPEDLKRINKEVKKFNSNKQNLYTHKPYRLICKNGTLKWFNDVTYLTNAKNDEAVLFDGIITDITSEIVAKEKIKKLKKELQLKNKELTIINENLTLEKERFKDIIENTSEWIWEIDIKGNFIYSNSLVKKISGFTAKEIINKNIFQFVDKKYKSNLTKEFNKYVSQQKGWHNIEIKFLHKNGSLRYIESNVVVILDKKGILTGFRGINRDITKRKLDEKENAKLLVAVEQSANSIIITDIKGNIEYTNPKFTKITGYTAKEVLGKNPRVLKSGKQPDEYYATMWKTISGGKIWHGEFLNKAKNGNLFWEQATITPIKNKGNKITNYIALKEDITSQKKARLELNETFEKLKTHEAYLNNILQTADEGFWIIDNKTNTVDLNTKMCKILGYPKSKIVGTSIYEFVNEQNATIFKEQLKLRGLGKSSSYELELTTHKGKQIPCFFKTAPLFDEQKNKKGSFAFVTNISTLKKSYEILENKNIKLKELSSQLSEKNRLLFANTKRYQNLFNENPVALWEEDFSEVKKLLSKKSKEVKNLKIYLQNNPDFVFKCISKVKVINVNKAAVELFGVQSKEALLIGFGDNFTEKSLNTFTKELIDIYENKEDIVHKTDIYKEDGSIINAIMRIVQIENNRTIVSINDVTEINKAREKAEESNRLKTEFLNNMSHEIRTPMNGILGFTEFLNNDDITPEKRKNFIQIIQNSGKQLLHVIDDILEISRLGTKQVTIDETEVCINNLMNELFTIFEIKAKETGIPIYLKKILSDTESTVLTDSLKLNKILGNLLENAYKFTNNGFIEFGYKLNNNTLDFYVKDTGIGIKPEKQESIFERFSQEEKELSKKFGGLGLGLSIAKENTNLLGGEITLESVKGVGSTFTVSIPYKPISTKTITTNKKQSKKLECNILIVEDEQMNFMFLETLLLDVLKLDCTLHHVKNGQEAVDFCEKNSKTDLILMDLKMPVMNGFEATKIIKEKHPTIPIIAQTAYSSDSDKKRAFDAGCNEFISKPICKESLTEILSNYIKV